jgi:uncharacterized membrane protein
MNDFHKAAFCKNMPQSSSATAGSDFTDRLWHRAFCAAIVFKGLDGVLELISGILFLCVPFPDLAELFFRVGRSAWMQDPDDFIARSLRHGFDHLSAANKIFAGVYLLGHGVVKLMLVVGLWRNQRWVFPVATLTIAAFIIYQTVRLVHHFSATLVVLMVLDVAVLGLIWREYHSRRGREPAQG